MIYCGVNFEIAHSINLSLLFLGNSHQYMIDNNVHQVVKGMATDVYTTAVWSLSVCVVNSIKTLVQVA